MRKLNILKSIAAERNGCSKMRLYFFRYPCYNLPDWKKSKRDQREHLLFFQSGSEEPKVLSVPE